MLGREAAVADRCGGGFAINLAGFFDGGLEHIHTGVALYTVVVRAGVVGGLELFAPGLQLWGFHGQTDVGHRAVGGFTGQLHHFGAGQHRLANHRFVPGLFAQLAQQAGRFLFVGVGEQSVCARLFGLNDSSGKVNLARFGGNFSHDLGGRVGQQLFDGRLTAFAKVVVHIQDRQLFRLAVDVARHFGE